MCYWIQAIQTDHQRKSVVMQVSPHLKVDGITGLHNSSNDCRGVYYIWLTAQHRHIKLLLYNYTTGIYILLRRLKREGLYTDWGPIGFDVATHPLMLMVSDHEWYTPCMCLTGVSVYRFRTSGLNCSTIL